MTQINGFINLYKNSGITSNKALSTLKNILKENNISTKVGHLGTLDPLAQGVLPVGLGRATRIFAYTLNKVKRYTATFKFGINTDTLDSDGKVIDNCDVLPTSCQIKSILNSLVGEIEQVPPAYSAKSINGVRAYKLARQGEQFTLKPKKVNIFSIELLQQIDDATYTFDIACSGGTYIRAIVRDIAKLLNTYGIMTQLTRTQSGYFNIDTCVKIEDIKENLHKYIIPIDKPLEYMPKYIVKDKHKKLVLNGVAVSLDDLPNGYFRVYIDDKLIGIAERNQENRLKIKTWLL